MSGNTSWVSAGWSVTRSGLSVSHRPTGRTPAKFEAGSAAREAVGGANQAVEESLGEDNELAIAQVLWDFRKKPTTNLTDPDARAEPSLDREEHRLVEVAHA